MTIVSTYSVDTARDRHAIDVTDVVSTDLPSDGFVLISAPHTTCAVVVSEPDADLLSDLEDVTRTILASHEPFRHARHDNPNAASHILSSLLGASLTIRVADGRLCLGTWQRVVLVELDGPKTRTLEVAWLSG